MLSKDSRVIFTSAINDRIIDIIVRFAQRYLIIISGGCHRCRIISIWSSWPREGILWVNEFLGLDIFDDFEFFQFIWIWCTAIILLFVVHDELTLPGQSLITCLPIQIKHFTQIAYRILKPHSFLHFFQLIQLQTTNGFSLQLRQLLLLLLLLNAIKDKVMTSLLLLSHFRSWLRLPSKLFLISSTSFNWVVLHELLQITSTLRLAHSTTHLQTIGHSVAPLLLWSV